MINPNFNMQFKTDNAAFADAESTEVARILRDTADKIERGAHDGIVRDVNGNRVGEWSLESNNDE